MVLRVVLSPIWGWFYARDHTKANATAKVQIELPEFTGKNLDKGAGQFPTFLKFTGQVNALVPILLDLIERCCKKEWLEEEV